MGGWRTAQSPILKTTITLTRLKKRGYIAMLEMPDSRPMSSIGKKSHELRINDQNKTWRIIYFIDDEAIVILDVFAKKSQKTPSEVIDVCKKRLALYKK